MKRRVRSLLRLEWWSCGSHSIIRKQIHSHMIGIFENNKRGETDEVELRITVFWDLTIAFVTTAQYFLACETRIHFEPELARQPMKLPRENLCADILKICILTTTIYFGCKLIGKRKIHSSS